MGRHAGCRICRFRAGASRCVTPQGPCCARLCSTRQPEPLRQQAGPPSQLPSCRVSRPRQEPQGVAAQPSRRSARAGGSPGAACQPHAPGSTNCSAGTAEPPHPHAADDGGLQLGLVAGAEAAVGLGRVKEVCEGSAASTSSVRGYVQQRRAVEHAHSTCCVPSQQADGSSRRAFDVSMQRGCGDHVARSWLRRIRPRQLSYLSQ